MAEMKSPADHDEAPPSEDGAKPGADISFPYDRMTVEQFRRRFPVPAGAMSARLGSFPGGRSRRIGRWLAEMEAETDAHAHAHAKGRDAFVFDPIDSPYLELGKASFRIRTPYSKTVVDELREVPFSRWDGGDALIIRDMLRQLPLLGGGRK